MWRESSGRVNPTNMQSVPNSGRSRPRCPLRRHGHRAARTVDSPAASADGTIATHRRPCRLFDLLHRLVAATFPEQLLIGARTDGAVIELGVRGSESCRRTCADGGSDTARGRILVPGDFREGARIRERYRVGCGRTKGV